MEYIFELYDLLTTAIQAHWIVFVTLLIGVCFVLGNVYIYIFPHGAINGFMSLKKAKELAPYMFGEPKEDHRNKDS